MSAFCICGHPHTWHSKIDVREWCAGGTLRKRCACTHYEHGAELEDLAEVAAREALAEWQRARRRGWRWEPDEGDRAWSEDKDRRAKERSGI